MISRQYPFYFAVAFSMVAAAVCSAQTVRVPQDQATIQQAIAAVPNGGIIEIADGTYNAPSGGFTIYGGTKGFTMRAVQGANVILDGGGNTDMLRFTDCVHPVSFERLTFVGGKTTTSFIGGAVTLVNVKANFTSCTFRNSSAGTTHGTGGGAVWGKTAALSFVNCAFTNNSSPNWGGGIAILNSQLYLRNCSFNGNRVNFPNHAFNSAGGGVYGVNSTVQVNNCSFDNNQAGYTGGAIYLVGDWDSSGSTLNVADSEFSTNSASRDATVSFAGPAVGGAIHIENDVTMKLSRSRFTGNVARQGGALSFFKTVAAIDNCVFRGNLSTGVGAQEGFGGTIMALSTDFSAPNRRPTQIDITDTLFQGSGTTSSGREGGCIFIGGDPNSAFGLNGVPANGTLDSNRATLNLTRVGIYGFSAVAGGSLPGTGAAIEAVLVNLTIDHSIISDCTSTDSGAGLQMNQGTVAKITNSTIARCKSGNLGAAITMFGGTLNANGSTFIQNQNAGGRGAAITTGPQPGAADGTTPNFDETGLVQNCVFAGNVGDTTLYNGDRALAPFNRLQYGANQFAPDTTRIFVSDFGGVQTVDGMNRFRIGPGGITSVLAPTANIALGSQPVHKGLLMLPPSVMSGGAPGEQLPSPSYLAYASNGGTASIDGAAQRLSGGLVATTSSAVHTLTVGSESVSVNSPAGAPLNISTRLPVGTGDNVLIAGFILNGNAPKTVVVRAVGPSLAALGVANTLSNPKLDLFDASGTNIASNDDWRTTQLGRLITDDQQVQLQSTGIAPQDGREPAMLVRLSPNVAYTAKVSGSGGAIGTAVVEVYDVDGPVDSHLANISTRGLIGGGDDVMIAGFIYGGGAPGTKVLVRGLGPSLGAFFSNALADPVLEVHDGNGTQVARDDNWQDSQAGQIAATGLNPKEDAESAILLTGLSRGAYTAILRGNGAGTGIGLVEVYVF